MFVFVLFVCNIFLLYNRAYAYRVDVACKKHNYRRNSTDAYLSMYVLIF